MRRILGILALCVCYHSSASGLVIISDDFLRADANSDGQVDQSDWVFIQNYIWSGGPAPSCMDAADVNDDGDVDNSDPIWLMNYLYDGGPPPPAPFASCGQDPTSDSIDCYSGTCP